jgi:hypothetical protein
MLRGWNGWRQVFSAHFLVRCFGSLTGGLRLNGVRLSSDVCFIFDF